MLGSGSSIFANADAYEACLPFQTTLVALQPGQFRTRLTWMELPHIRLMHARETLSRIAYVSLPPDQVYLTFPTNRHAPLIHNGVSQRWGDVVLHSPGERFHQRTTGPSSWGTISIAPSTLRSYGRLLNGCDLTLPAGDQRRHLHLIDSKELLGLHRQAVHLAETALDRLVHPEIIRALENDLIVVLMNCLINSNVRAAPTANRRQVAILTQLEDILSAASCRLLQVPEICRTIGVSARTLRSCCIQVLGISAVHYVHLRRLRQTRQALLSAEGRAGAITEIIGCYGFTDPRRFVMAYRRAFGEAPMLKP